MFLNIFAIAVAMAMDAFAVAIATGVCLQTVTLRQTFRLSWHFGLFQAMMPVIGWGAGLTIREHIEKYDHWAAFILLAVVAAGMLKSAFESQEKKDACAPKDPTKGFSLVMLSLATSMDALAVGLSLSILNLPIAYSATVIGVVALVFTVVGLHLGKTAASAAKLGRWAEAAGGLVLIFIGITILHEHGVF